MSVSNALQRVDRLLLLPAASLCAAAQRTSKLFHAALEGLAVELVDRRQVAAEGRDLGDSGAHGPGADDAESNGFAINPHLLGFACGDMGLPRGPPGTPVFSLIR